MSKQQADSQHNFKPSADTPPEGQPSINVTKTMPMSDLQLGSDFNTPRKSLLDKVEELVEQSDQLDSQNNPLDQGNPLEQVDEISRKIERLSASLQRPQSFTENPETASRLIGLDAQLAQLQIEVKQQQSKSSRLENGLSLIEALTEKIDTLGQTIATTTEQANNNDFHDKFDAIAEQLRENNSQLFEQLDQSSVYDEQRKAFQELNLRIAELVNSSDNEDTLKEFKQKIDALGEQIGQAKWMDELDNKLRTLASQIAPGDQLTGLESKIDQVAGSLLEKLDHDSRSNESNEQLNVLGQKLESLQNVMQESIPKDHFSSLDTRLDTLSQALSNNDKFGEVGQQIEQLSNFIKLGALESEQFDAARFDTMAEQVTAIGQMLVESNQSEPNTGSDERFEQLNSKVDALARLVEANQSGSNEGSDERFEQLNTKFDALVRIVESKESVVNPESDQQHALLAEKLDALYVLTNQNLHSSSSGESFDNGKLESITDQLSSLAQQIENQSAAGVSFDGEMPNHSSEIEALSAKVEQTQNAVASMVEQMMPLLENLQNQPVTIAQPASCPSPESAESADPIAVDEPELSDWEKQKRALLEGYGVAPETPAKTPGNPQPAVSKSEPTIDEPTIDEPTAVEPAVDPADEVSSPEIEDLRAQLEEKLRRAEIDISIERAKIHQERRDLEEMQSDLDRKQAKIDHHSGTSESDGEDEGESPGRWSRFLGN